MPFLELPVTVDSDIIEIKVKGYKRKIKRKKYVEACQCRENNRIITAPGHEKLILKSNIGQSIWACILIRKYLYQIVMTRILKKLSLNGLDLPAGTIGDGLKRIAPEYETIYYALKEKSKQSHWWQADETRWNVFKITKTKIIYLWYLLNALRIQYPVLSQEFRREDEHICQALSRTENDFEEELKQACLYHEKERVLRNLKNHWEGLTVFADHPYVPSDKNGSERTLRNPASGRKDHPEERIAREKEPPGRKNYYGPGTVWSNPFTTCILSIFEALELWGINQHQWLSEYLNACAPEEGKPPSDIAPFLPWHNCDRVFSKSDIVCIKTILNEDTSHDRTTISRIVYEYLNWYKPDRTLKERSKGVALLKEEKDKYISLPPAEDARQVVQLPITHTKRTAPQEDTSVSSDALSNLSINIAKTKEENSLWNEYIERYYYPGYKIIPGDYIKYFICAEDKLLSIMGFGPAAWRIAPRDEFIGWSDKARQENLRLVINNTHNTQFIVLPWIYLKNLASKLFSLIPKRITDGRQQRYSYRPLLPETFAEKEQFSGICYKADNWRFIGVTKGRGKKDRFHKVSLPQKNVLIYPITRNFEKILC